MSSSARLARCLFVTVASVVVSACADYRFTVNDRVVYNPAPLFSAFDVPDGALEACLRQHIADASVTAVQQLTDLNCSHAGVSDLAGLEVFTHLVRLKLSNNAISSVVPLANITSLQELYLDGNKLGSIMPLRGMLGLKYLNLQANADIVCQQLEFFRRQPGLELESPDHC